MKRFLLSAALGILIVTAAPAFDVEIIHFEDGSGRLTYCLPLTDCALDAYAATVEWTYTDEIREQEYECMMTLAERGDHEPDEIAEICQQ